jgi:hypothetical protein
MADEPSESASPETLYHYTTTSGLVGILRGKKIWATNIGYLNDKMEFDQAIRVFKELVGRDVIEGSAQIEFDRMLKNLDKLKSETFVASFSEKGDQLSQWRGYCSGDSGFNIGFNYVELRKKFEQENEPDMLLEKCIYDQDEQKARLAEAAKYIRSKGFERPVGEAMGVGLYLLAPSFKNNAFSEEVEWRLIVYGPKGSDIKFREGKGFLIPYYEIDLRADNGQLPIDWVTIGPTIYESESRTSLKMLLEQEGIPADRIRVSEVPYREM